MNTRIKICLLIALMFGVSGCSLVDIRSQQLIATGQDASLQKKGERLLQLATWTQDKAGYWDRFDQWNIVAVDMWKSGIIRRFTPLDLNEQQLEFNFKIHEDTAYMKFLNGKRMNQILGDESGRTFVVEDGSNVYKADKKNSAYLRPVRDYFFWTQTLVNRRIVMYEGQGTYNDQTYHKIFVTDGEFYPSEDHDQYMVWINQKTLKIEFIEFTLRDLLKSYRGVAQYADFKKVQGINLPHRLILKDKIASDKYSHQFLIEEMSFEKSPQDLSFIIDIKPFTLDLGIN